jgi:hypothetical protein
VEGRQLLDGQDPQEEVQDEEGGSEQGGDFEEEIEEGEAYQEAVLMAKKWSNETGWIGERTAKEWLPFFRRKKPQYEYKIVKTGGTRGWTHKIMRRKK